MITHKASDKAQKILFGNKIDKKNSRKYFFMKILEQPKKN